MSSLLNFPLLSALMLGTFASCSTATPLVNAVSTSEKPTSEASEAEPLLYESPVWDSFIAVTRRHKKQFEEELSDSNYDFLERIEIPSPPSACHVTLDKETCLLRLVEALQVYKVLLMHVKREYPDNSLLHSIKYYSDLLIQLINKKMRNPEDVAVLSDFEAELVLQALNNADTFGRRLTAHSILRKLHLFLIDSKNELARKEKAMFNHRTQQSRERPLGVL